MMMLGIDVAKAKFDAALLREGTFMHKTFANTAEGFEALRHWLHAQDVAQVHACLEATGSYGEALAQWLFDAGHVVSVLNPAQVKDFARSLLTRNKTDTVDAAVLARFGAALRPAPWQPPAPEVRVLRALLRRLVALEEAHQQEHNRLGVADAEVRDSIQRHLEYLEAALAQLRGRIQEHIDQHPGLKHKQALLQSIPGIGTVVREPAQLDHPHRSLRQRTATGRLCRPDPQAP